MKLGQISIGKTEATNIQRFFAELNLGGDPQLRPAHIQRVVVRQSDFVA